MKVIKRCRRSMRKKLKRSAINYGDHMKIPAPIAQRKNENLLTTQIDRLPLELFSDILERLPAEELLRCKCVCKRWCHEIESPIFIKSHARRIANDNIYNSSSIIIYTPGDDIRDTTLSCIDFLSPEKLEIKQLGRYFRSFLRKTSSPILVGSCNGLLCFLHRDHDHIFSTRRFSVYNPITGEYKIMPAWNYSPSVGLQIGFGYDCMSGDYKIFCFAIDNRHIWTTHARVYSLMSNSWEVIMEPCPSPQGHIRTKSMVLSNNALHFITYSYNIYGFDLGSHKYHEIARPINQVGDHSFIELVELRGCLHLVSETEIWIMKEYGVKESWIKLYHFSQETETSYIDRLHWRELWMMPYAYSEDGTQILMIKGPSPHRFFWVDLQFKKVQMSSTLPHSEMGGNGVTPWFGSFVSPASVGSSTSYFY